jgi:2-haloacid dehalogenase
VLQVLKEKGIATAILFNGTEKRLAGIVESNRLKPYLDQILTIEALRIFKTAAQC